MTKEEFVEHIKNMSEEEYCSKYGACDYCFYRSGCTKPKFERCKDMYNGEWK